MTVATNQSGALASAGVAVTDVKKLEAPGLAGVKKRDVLIEVNGKKVNDNASFAKALKTCVPGSMGSFLTLRKEQVHTHQMVIAAQGYPKALVGGIYRLANFKEEDFELDLTRFAGFE